LKRKQKQKESSKARQIWKVKTKKGNEKKKMNEEKNAQNQQKVAKKIKAKQLAAQMVLLSKELNKVQNTARQLATQLEFLTKESVEVLRDVLTH